MAPATDSSTTMAGTSPQIEIHVNAEPQTLRAVTLADVLVALGYGEMKVATALNGEFVPERLRSSAPVASGDRIEILAARQGG